MMNIETPGLQESRGNANHTTIHIDNNSGGASDKNGPSVIFEGGIPDTTSKGKFIEDHRASLRRQSSWMHDKTDSLNQGDLKIDDALGKVKRKDNGVGALIEISKNKRPLANKFSNSGQDSEANDHMLEAMQLELKDQNEEQLRKDLVEALNELQAKDIDVLGDMHSFKMSRPTRTFFYIFTFVPLLLFELGHAWFNAASIRRIKKAATAYDKYHSATMTKLKASLDQDLITCALSGQGKSELDANEKKSSLRLLSIKHVRKSFLGKDATASALRTLRGDRPRNYEADRIMNNIAAEYISKQIASNEGAHRYSTRLKVARRYFEHSKHYNPFATKSDLITNNDSATKVKEIGADLAGKFKKSAEKIAQDSSKAVVAALPGLIDQTTTAAKSSLSAVTAK